MTMIQENPVVHGPSVTVESVMTILERAQFPDAVIDAAVQVIEAWERDEVLPTDLTPNEQLLIGELEKAAGIIEDLESRLSRHELAKRNGSESARAAIRKAAKQ